MIEKVKNVSSFVLGLAVIVLAGYFVIVIIQGGSQVYLSLKENTQIAIAVGLLSLFGTLFSLYYTKIKDRQLQIDASHAVKKQKLYNLFVESIIELIAHPEKDKDGSLSLSVKKKFMSNSLLWSNPEALKAYHEFRTAVQEGGSDGYVKLASLFLSFRSDLGLSNKGIDERTIIEIMYDKDDIKELEIFSGDK